MSTSQPPASLLQRVLWFVLLWTAGVAAVGAVAFAIRTWLVP